jgi:hypothetical protein
VLNLSPRLFSMCCNFSMVTLRFTWGSFNPLTNLFWKWGSSDPFKPQAEGATSPSGTNLMCLFDRGWRRKRSHFNHHFSLTNENKFVGLYGTFSTIWSLKRGNKKGEKRRLYEVMNKSSIWSIQFYTLLIKIHAVVYQTDSLTIVWRNLIIITPSLADMYLNIFNAMKNNFTDICAVNSNIKRDIIMCFTNFLIYLDWKSTRNKKVYLNCRYFEIWWSSINISNNISYIKRSSCLTWTVKICFFNVKTYQLYAL